MPNPYVPPRSSNQDASPMVAPASTWHRNVAAVAVVSVIYSLPCALFAIKHSAMPEALYVLLFAVSAIASAWANVQLGPRIGWNQGGLPVVMIAFVLAIVAYFLIALVIGGTVYGVMNWLALADGID